MHSQVSERRFDLSRDTFDPTKLYRSIVKQQGRVTVDADDNEQRRIELHRSDLTTLDVIGPCGYPAGGTGFKIGAAGKLLTVGTGRMYVHGLMAENFVTSPQLLLDSATPGAPPSLLVVANNAYQNLASGTYLAYLDVWERDVTALDDPSIRETALGGPDTAARTELVAQVHLTAVQSGATCATAALPVLPDHLGTLKAETNPAAAAQDCTLPPLAGFRGQENQLYRVEIHHGGALGTATFKWSRENGSVVTGITGPASGPVGLTFTVQSVGADSMLGFPNVGWVELIDDDVVLTGQPGFLALTKSVDPSTLTVTLDPAAPNGVIGYGKNPKIRRWEQNDFTAANGVATAAAPFDLENGVRVTFGSGFPFFAGDYWLIPARTAIDQETGTLLVPPAARKPSHTAHHLCSLAVIAYDTTNGWGVPSDCRIPFPPLTSLPTIGCCCATVTVGDGTTSRGQFTDIAAAVASLPAGGGVVSIEAGSYTLANPVQLPANVILRGCGRSTLITANNGAFVAGGSNTTIEDLTMTIQTAPAVATASGKVVERLVVRRNAVTGPANLQTSPCYAFSFAASEVTIAENTLTRLGVEVQPASSKVTIHDNTITGALQRGISIGSTVVAPGTAGGTSFDFTTFANLAAALKEVGDVAKTGTVGIARVQGVTVEENVIDAASLEGIGAETLVAISDAATNKLLFVMCSDVTIAGNTIRGCLLDPRTKSQRELTASAAISVPIVERLTIVRNTIVQNGLRIAASGICSFLASGTEIRQNHILQNGIGASPNGIYGMAAIELFIAFPAPPPFAEPGGILSPAIMVSDNVVTNRNAAAFFALADGQISVSGNDFTVVGRSESQLTPGQCVDIFDFGLGAQEMVASAAFFGNVIQLQDDRIKTFSPDAAVVGGQVLFEGNRCLYDGRDAGAAAGGLLLGSILIGSEDAVLIEGNQSRCFVLASSQSGTPGTLVANLTATSVVAQVSNNRLSEDSAFASAFVYGGDTVGIGNHGTHCLFFFGTGKLVDASNIVNPLNAALCPNVRRALSGSPL